MLGLNFARANAAAFPSVFLFEELYQIDVC
jgi:hypothetical protein